MSSEFIRAGHNAKSLRQAVSQQRQIEYLINSKLQEERLDPEYLSQWANRKFSTNDYFLNWIKSIFKTENFLTFYKYLRFPLPSSKIVHNRIEPQLFRVFNAEDADFKYVVTGHDFADFSDDLKIKQFNSELFRRLLYAHNSLVISDLDRFEANKPYRYFIDIQDVISLKYKGEQIEKICFKGCIQEIEYEDGEIEKEYESGFVYVDAEKYAFYDDEYEFVSEAPHDLGYCPVHFISPKKFNNDFCIRESLFTYIREEIEEYNFLRTLQKMTEVNGAIPVVSKIETNNKVADQVRSNEGEPDSNAIMGSQRASVYSENISLGTGDLQPGTIHEIPIDAIRTDDGGLNMDVVRNYLNFHYTPIEALDYLNKRINELERSIVSTIVGDFLESNESAKNEDQIQKSISILENTLTVLAETLNQIRKKSDFDMLALKYGINSVKSVFIHYGTDFFLDSQTKLFEDLEKAPNPLERKNIIVRISQNRYKNNSDQLSRQRLLYDLMPYVSDKDFEKAIELQIVTQINKDYQLRFNYWIDQFEAVYGDIVVFYASMQTESKAEKLLLINNLITDMISKQLPQQAAQNKENEDSNLA